MSEEHLGFDNPEALMRGIRQATQDADLDRNDMTLFLFLCEFPCRDQAGYFLNDPVTAELACESEVTQQAPDSWLCSMARILNPDTSEATIFCETLIEQVLLYRGKLVATELASTGEQFHVLGQESIANHDATTVSFAVTTPARFPDLDMTFYQEFTVEFRALGFSHVADLEASCMPSCRDHHTFTRYLLHPQTSTVAKGTLLPGSLSGLTELESLMSDGTVVCTLTDDTSENEKDRRGLILNPLTGGMYPEDVLRLHLQKVEDHCAANPFVAVHPLRTLDDVIDLQQTMARLRNTAESKVNGL